MPDMFHPPPAPDPLYDPVEKPAKAYKPKDQPEHRFSHWAMTLFERIIPEPCYFTAVDHSGEPIGGDPNKNMRWREKQKAMGIRSSQLDWQVFQFERGPDDAEVWPVKAVTWIELKRGKNQLTDGQRGTIRMFQQRHQIAAEARTPTDCLRILRRAGFELHANADNITAEIEARLAAADRAAPDKLAKKARRAGGATRKGRARSGKRVSGVRLWGGLAREPGR